MSNMFSDSVSFANSSVFKAFIMLCFSHKAFIIWIGILHNKLGLICFSGGKEIHVWKKDYGLQWKLGQHTFC